MKYLLLLVSWFAGLQAIGQNITVTMQIRKNALLILIILAVLLLIVSVIIFFNRRIQEMEAERQVPHSENMQRQTSFIIKS